MPTLPKISDAEWEIMNLLWEKSPLSVYEIAQKLEHQQDWTYKTIGSFLNRLTKKGALRFERRSKQYFYYPTMPRQSCIRSESRSFLERVFCGQIGELLTHFVEDVKLTPTEVSQLQRILAKKGHS